MNSTCRRLRILQLKDLHISDDMNISCATCKYWGNTSYDVRGVCYAAKGLIQDNKQYWPETNALETCIKWTQKPDEAA